MNRRSGQVHDLEFDVARRVWGSEAADTHAFPPAGTVVADPFRLYDDSPDVDCVVSFLLQATTGRG